MGFSLWQSGRACDRLGGAVLFKAMTPLEALIRTGIQFLAMGAGVILVVMMGWAGFRYLTAGDNSGQVSEAKQRMFQLFISILLYIFGLAFLNFLTPGGLF